MYIISYNRGAETLVSFPKQVLSGCRYSRGSVWGCSPGVSTDDVTPRNVVGGSRTAGHPAAPVRRLLLALMLALAPHWSDSSSASLEIDPGPGPGHTTLRLITIETIRGRVHKRRAKARVCVGASILFIIYIH